MKKRELIPYGIAILMLLIGALYDYQITDALFRPTSVFGIFFARIMLVPIQSMVIITIAMLYRKHQHILFLFMGEAVSFYVVKDTLQYWMNIQTNFMMACIILISVLFVVLIFYFVSLCSLHTIEKHISFFIFFTVVLLSATVVTSIIKTYWGRIRYRDLLNAGNFCVWYKPCGLYGNHSFPSGHTTAFTSIICFLQWKQNRYEKVPMIRYICITTLILLMPISRMIMGAHFLSDTAMGFIITYSCYLIYRRIFFKGGYL